MHFFETFRSLCKSQYQYQYQTEFIIKSKSLINIECLAADINEYLLPFYKGTD